MLRVRGALRSPKSLRDLAVELMCFQPSEKSKALAACLWILKYLRLLSDCSNNVQDLVDYFPGLSQDDDIDIRRDDCYMPFQEPARRQPKSRLRKGSRKWQFKSPREDDNDDDNHETLAMIRQQLYSPGGPYGNMMVNPTNQKSNFSQTLIGGNLKRCWNEHEDEEEMAFSEQPANKNKLGSSDFSYLGIQWCGGDMSVLKSFKRQPRSSFRRGSGKWQFKSPREDDNDDNNHETLAMIRQQLYGPGGPYENMMANQTDESSLCSETFPTNSKRGRDDHKDEEETASTRQPAKKPKLISLTLEHRARSGCRTVMANLEHINGQRKSRFRKGSRKVQFKLPCEVDNDDDDHKTFVMIYQQLYGPGGPYENILVNQADTNSPCSETFPANSKQCQDDHKDEEEIAFSPQPAETPKLVSLTSVCPAISEHRTDMANLGSINRQSKYNLRKCRRTVHFKLPDEGDRDHDHDKPL